MNKRKYQSDKYKEYQREYAQRPEVKAKKIEYSKTSRSKEYQREYAQRPEVKAKKLEQQRIRNQTKDYKIKRSIWSKNYIKNPEVKERKKQYNSKYNEIYYRRPEVQKRIRDRRFQRTFGITLARYEEMLFIQNNVCKICKKDNGEKFLCIDHNHTTQEIRGLLCDKCNQAIGLLRENLEIIQSAYEYIESNMVT